MTTSKRRNASGKRREAAGYNLSPSQYRDVLAGLKLKDIELAACNMSKVSVELTSVCRIKANITRKAKMEQRGPGTAVVLHEYRVTGTIKSDVEIFRLDCTFRLAFESEQELSQEFFVIFRDINLPIITWPHLRELVGSMTGRTDLPKLTLPLVMTG